MEMNKIPAQVQCLLSASARVNNYQRAVEELVYNSLDAESTCIAIRIHVQKSWIQVVDKGSGIKKADYKLLGERYATSKLIDEKTLKAAPSKYGYQGQALSNIIEVSQSVKITSRSTNTNETWVKIFNKGNKEQKCLKVPMRPSKGTTVEVIGFLLNRNIQKNSINEFSECEDIKYFLKQLSLVSNNVSITLRDDATNEIIFKMQKSKDIYQTFQTVFNIECDQIQELQVEKNEYKVKAYIGIEKTEIKNYHWIYLNNKCMHSSNIHKVIYNKFAKQEPKKKKIKTLGGYNEDSFVGQLVPFYFLFITCPYYDYDIFHSAKKITIEFKNWDQINKLIEKLVGFFEGDINIVKLENTKKRRQFPAEVKDTKKQVKKIMERILGKPNTMSRVSQIPNGVKGKRVKRKKKKQGIDKPLTKLQIAPINETIKIALPYKEKQCVNVKVRGKEFDKHAIIKTNGSNEQIQEKIKNYNLKHRSSRNCQKFSKNTITRKNNTKPYNILEMFKNNSDTIERRCNEMSFYLDHLFNFKDSQPFTLDRHANKSILLNDDIKGNQAYKTEEKINTTAMRRQQCSIDYNNPITEKIRSYDLLKTIMNTQQTFIDVVRRDDKIYTTKQSNLQQENNINNHYLSSKHTYNSHKYNNKDNYNRRNKSRNIPSITEQSRDNFYFKTDKTKGCFKIKTDEITKTYGGLRDNKMKKPRDIAQFDNIFKNNRIKDSLETPHSIEIFGNNIMDVSKRIHYHIANHMKSIQDNKVNGKIHKSQLDCSEKFSMGVNLNIESTYTILMDTLYNSPQTINTDRKVKTTLEKSITSKQINDNNNMYTNQISNIISNEALISKPRSVSTDATMEPLDICEAIIDSPLHFHDEIRTNFNAIGFGASSFMIEKLKSCEISESNSLKNRLNIDISECTKIKSKNKMLHQESLPKVTSINKNLEKNASLDNYEILSQVEDENYNCSNFKIIQGNSADNFTINTRNRYLPKGTSQIFMNCFSKGICSYNLETEYYDNTIYNNFVEDVAANSEVFEPKVQNMKDLLTKDIQKVTDKFKKHNADLIFGTDSLRGAKVVLGQVDNKFIAAKIQQAHQSPQFLVFFDQHAVHERICLETNLSSYFNGNNWTKVTIDAFSLKSSKEEIIYLHNNKEKFTRFGLEWTIPNQSEIVVSAIPEAIKGKNPRTMETIARAVKNLILEEIHYLKYLKGNMSIYPQSIMNLIFSEACRYAIKFGDQLCLKDCTELIGALANCKTPFQCAHGRPVMAVMMELKNEHFEYKANVNSIKKFKNRLKR